jgi:hypothetical protein
MQSEDTWGQKAEFRDDLLHQAEQWGEPCVTELRDELEQLGPLGLWRETARGYLSDHGFVQSEKESFPETMARALGINTGRVKGLHRGKSNWQGVAGEVQGA